uniref:Cilia and flagella associated protein 100 n=1 Tax=Xiphophorus maculatus TaxID=8083 RepID=A0A3B5Q7G8_XIPMA
KKKKKKKGFSRVKVMLLSPQPLCFFFLFLFFFGAQEMRKFLALPIEEKATHAARALAKLKNELVGELEEEEEENEKKESLKQIRSKAAFPKQTPSTHELKITTAKGGNAREGWRSSLSLMTKRSEILKMEKAVAKEERKLKQLEKLIERDNQKFEEFLRENERKSVEARALFEREEKSKQEKNAVIKKLTAEMRTIQSELEKYEDALTDYLKYKDFLFRLSPAEWQDEQKSKDSKTKTSSKQNDGQEPTETGIWNNSLALLWLILRGQFALHQNVIPLECLSAVFHLCRPSSIQDKPELYFTDPQQLLDLMSELTEQNLSLIQNSARAGEALAKLRQTSDKQLVLKYQLFVVSKAFIIFKLLAVGFFFFFLYFFDFQDKMLDALNKKVTEVYSGCVENRITDLSTLQKVAKIESRVFSLLQSLEGMPVERLAVVKKVKESEKRSRMREEKLMEQREKQKERMRRYLERSLADSKKIVCLNPLISQSITYQRKNVFFFFACAPF